MGLWLFFYPIIFLCYFLLLFNSSSFLSFSFYYFCYVLCKMSSQVSVAGYLVFCCWKKKDKLLLQAIRCGATNLIMYLFSPKIFLSCSPCCGTSAISTAHDFVTSRVLPPIKHTPFSLSNTIICLCSTTESMRTLFPATASKAEKKTLRGPVAIEAPYNVVSDFVYSAHLETELPA